MQVVANIVVLSAIYALICCGFVLVYRVSRVLNLAHGELMMLGAYGLLTTAWLFAGNPYVAVAAALGLSLLIGVLVYVALMRRMAGELVFAAVLVTIALGITVRGISTLIWTAQIQYPRQALAIENPSIVLTGGAVVSTGQMLTVALAVAVYIGILVFFRMTRWGIRMRAAGESPLLAAQRGIRLHAIYAFAWGLATFTGGMAGMLVAFDGGVDETMVVIGLKAIPAALLGGLDSFRGAILGSIVVASAEILVHHQFNALLAEVMPFLILILMLMIRPWGLFGTKEELERV